MSDFLSSANRDAVKAVILNMNLIQLEHFLRGQFPDAVRHTQEFVSIYKCGCISKMQLKNKEDPTHPAMQKDMVLRGMQNREMLCIYCERKEAASKPKRGRGRPRKYPIDD